MPAARSARAGAAPTARTRAARMTQRGLIALSSNPREASAYRGGLGFARLNVHRCTFSAGEQRRPTMPTTLRKALALLVSASLFLLISLGGAQALAAKNPKGTGSALKALVKQSN